MAAVKDLGAEVLEDLKGSWRFKVAIVMWIPLIVTTIVALAQFGLMNKNGNAQTFANTQIVSESVVNFPMFYLYRGSDNLAFNTGGYCWIPPNTQDIVVTTPCTGIYGDIPTQNDRTKCFMVKPTAAQTASVGRRRIQCTLTTAPTWISNNNPVLQLTVVGADGIPDDMVWINAMQNVQPPVSNVQQPGLSVAFQQVLTMASESANVDISWSADIDYYSQNWLNQSLATQSWNFEVRIDDFQNIQYGNYNSFTNYQFLAAWGGVMFFFYVLFAFVFFIVKLFMPDDSKVLGSHPKGAAETYTPIR